MSLAKYLDTKDSGVDWLGEIPSHWTVKELKYVCTNQPSNVDKKTVEGEEVVSLCNYTDVYYNDVITPDLPLMRASATDDQIEKFTLRAGDVIITKDSESADDIAVSTYVPQDMPGVVCGYHLAMIRPNDGVFGLFIKRLFDSVYIQSKVATLANGLTRFGLSHAAVGGLELPMPPDEDEQKAISSFLDVETSKIDSLVSEQRRLIELLKEKRQAVISHAVTKGLNPNAPMKPSGIQWLGDVPQHWNASMISRVSTKITNGYVGPTRDILVEDGVPYIQATHIKRGRVNFDGAYFVKDEWSNKHSKSILELGDVLIVQTGAGTGDIGLVSENEVGFNCHALIIVQCIQETMIGQFLAATLQSQYGTQTLESIQTGGMHPHLNCGNVKFVYVPVPPLDEQQAIVDYVNERSQRFDALQAEAERAIELLQERRTALISAAVTGKIDVREFALQETA